MHKVTILCIFLLGLQVSELKAGSPTALRAVSLLPAPASSGGGDPASHVLVPVSLNAPAAPTAATGGLKAEASEAAMQQLHKLKVRAGPITLRLRVLRRIAFNIN